MFHTTFRVSPPCMDTVSFGKRFVDTLSTTRNITSALRKWTGQDIRIVHSSPGVYEVMVISNDPLKGEEVLLGFQLVDEAVYHCAQIIKSSGEPWVNAALANIKRAADISDKNDLACALSISLDNCAIILESGFQWSQSPEGSDFWLQVVNRLRMENK
jgi:hypothetical protein